MEQMRSPFQGLFNIIRFNWHYYAFAISIIIAMVLISFYLPKALTVYFLVAGIIVISLMLISLMVSFYVYDLSGIYQFKWLAPAADEKLVVNINAGFDETSHLLQHHFKTAELIALDFYNPELHTEVSIKRARKAYPPCPGTRATTTSRLPLSDNSADKVFAILSAHEIRDEKERITFFNEMHRIVKQEGEVIVIEHLRDLPNFLAYNVGFFHFLSRSSWLKVFRSSHFEIRKEIKITPFISTFILYKNGDTF